MSIDVEAITSLLTLVDEIKKVDVDHLWLLEKNMMSIVHIILCLMPTSISAERSFSVLDRVKTKLRNAMGDERMSSLAMLKVCPDMVENINVISLHSLSSV